MTDTEGPDLRAGADKLDRKVWLSAGVVVLGAIMSILDVTVVNIAMPTFQEKFDITQAVAGWTMTAYTLALAAIIPVTGWAADRFGTKRLYVVALVLFVLGSMLCSTAWNISSLIGFRVVQGLGGGMLMPLGMTILTRAAGPTRVGRVMAVMGVPMLLGPIGGPILGGWLIQSYSWEWIFRINLQVGILALVAALFILPGDVTSRHERFDWLGIAFPRSCAVSLRRHPDSVAAHVRLGGGARSCGHRVGVDGGIRVARVGRRASADRSATVPQPQHQCRGRDDGVLRVRVLRGSHVDSAVLPAGAWLRHVVERAADHPAGARRDDHHADRRSAGRPDRTGQDRDDRPVAHRRRHGLGAALARGRNSLLADRNRAFRDGHGYGLHHDADHERGDGEPERSRNRPRHNVDEYRQSSRRLDRNRGCLGCAHQPAAIASACPTRHRLEHEPGRSAQGRRTSSAARDRDRLDQRGQRVRHHLPGFRRIGRLHVHPGVPATPPSRRGAAEAVAAAAG